MAQPPSSNLSIRGFLSFPSRLCNPPPAVGRVRSCAVTPVLDIRLDDVLARRHLPPIGLKDLEEYLLYVEHAPENLYFVLWLKDYTARYQAWVQREKSCLLIPPNNDKSSFKTHRQKFAVPPTPDPALAMFYLRAKQTFLTPNGQYELNIPSDVLAPFHSNPHTHVLHSNPQDHARSSLWHSQSVHPDPAVFTEVAIEARYMLNESLRCFVRAAYTNVGSRRATCGIIAGCVFTLFAGFLPLLLTTGRWNIGSHTRLIRLAALPGLWFGLTVLIASLQGICLMVYIFGDLRQLRKFELARPMISRPTPIYPTMPSASAHVHRQSVYVPSRYIPVQEKTFEATSQTITFLDSPTLGSFISPTHRHAHSSSPSLVRTLTSCESCESVPYSSPECNGIDISPAFFDDVPAPEGPATASCLHRHEYRLPTSSIPYMEPAHLRPEGRPARMPNSSPTPETPVAVEPGPSARNTRSSIRSTSEYGPTAGFIPNDYSSSTTSLTRSVLSQRSACYFNFDLLPDPAGQCPQSDSTRAGDGVSPPAMGTNWNAPSTSPAVFNSSSQPPSSSLTGVIPFLGRTQYKCNQRTSPASTVLPSEKGLSTASSKDRSPRKFTLSTLIPSFTAGVPAFAAPLTPVQSPVVKRAQWEVVVRAALVAAVIASAVTGVVVGVVP